MACSCGQEIYSVLFTLEGFKLLNPNVTFKIKATDISSRAIDKARNGIYTPQEINRGLEKVLQDKYFDILPYRRPYSVRLLW